MGVSLFVNSFQLTEKIQMKYFQDFVPIETLISMLSVNEELLVC